MSTMHDWGSYDSWDMFSYGQGTQLQRQLDYSEREGRALEADVERLLNDNWDLQRRLAEAEVEIARLEAIVAELQSAT